MPNLADIIAQGALLLRQSGIDDPIADTRILCAALLGLDRAQLATQDQRVLSDAEIIQLNSAITRRANGEPVARILGHREFWSLLFAVNAATLVPRPDSETLIDVALTLFLDRRAPLRFLDLGTGSGCLLLALLSEFPNAVGIGTDIAPEAVKMAKHNAQTLGFAERSKFVVVDWSDADFTKKLSTTNRTLNLSFPRKRESRGLGTDVWHVALDSRVRGNDNGEERAKTFDLIISNPPYIAHDTIATLTSDVRDHDPMTALDGGADGLDAYRALAKILPDLWHVGSHALFEIGYDQATTAAEIFRAAGFTNIQLKRDLAGQPRCLVIAATKK